jgi:hypothetical protein
MDMAFLLHRQAHHALSGLGGSLAFANAGEKNPTL